jgi:ABC-type dipeptide/oligopeptide/nickel transport system ATPase component
MIRENSPILCVKNLGVAFSNSAKGARVLNHIDFSLAPGEIHGIVGPSGCGKSVFARTLVRLESPARIVSGSILLGDQELTDKTQRQMGAMRGKKISLVLQNPTAAMDPVFTMGNQFKDALSVATESKGLQQMPGAGCLGAIHGLLRKVGIASPRERCRQYPHEWSRGMLQRAQLVMAFSTSPGVVILDEVTSALDPTISLQILDMIVRFKKEQGMAIVLITHDLCAALEVCDRISVMHKGSIVETGTIGQIFDHPVHPYTRLLISTAFDDEQ